MYNGRAFILCMLLLAAASCSPRGDGIQMRNRSGEPSVVEVSDEDAEMNAAMAEARRTLPEFRRRLAAPPPTQSYSTLKVRFDDGSHVEHIWVDALTNVGEAIRGRIANRPLHVRGVTLGEEIAVPVDKVSDWMAIDDGRLIGGFTLRATRRRLSAEERAQFDAQLGCSVE